MLCPKLISLTLRGGCHHSLGMAWLVSGATRWMMGQLLNCQHKLCTLAWKHIVDTHTHVHMHTRVYGLVHAHKPTQASAHPGREVLNVLIVYQQVLRLRTCPNKHLHEILSSCMCGRTNQLPLTAVPASSLTQLMSQFCCIIECCSTCHVIYCHVTSATQ